MFLCVENKKGYYIEQLYYTTVMDTIILKQTTDYDKNKETCSHIDGLHIGGEGARHSQ